MNSTLAKIPRLYRWLAAVVLLLLLMIGSVQQAMDKSNANALWWVTKSCEHIKKYTHIAVVCEHVDLKRGYALLKDMRDNAQFLLIPTKRISGIESPEMLKPDATNYWLPAWEARKYVSKRVGKQLPDEDIGLAVNSFYGRTQNQLHIHIDCLKPEVIASVDARKEEQTGKWFKIHFPVQNVHGYHALFVDSLRTDPIKLLAESKEQMSRKTVVVTRVGNRFIVLARAADVKHGDYGTGEELLDHACKVANAPPPDPS